MFVGAVGFLASLVGIYSFLTGHYSLFQIFERAEWGSRFAASEVVGGSWGRTFVSWPGVGEVGVSVQPLPGGLPSRHAEYDWLTFRDDHWLWSEDFRFMGFRRCTGFDATGDPALCLVYLADRADGFLARPLVEEGSSVSFGTNYWPVGFYEYRLFTATYGRLLAATPGDRYAKMVLADAWAVSLRASDGQIAFLSSFRTGEPNLWMADVSGTSRRQLSRLRDCEPGHQTKWVRRGTEVLFEMECDGPLSIATWSYSIVEDVLVKVRGGQIADAGR